MFDTTLGIFIAFIITIAILVAIHEFGHFWVARRLGVKVLTFSIGFGKQLFKWKDKLGTTYQVSLIPLGGYVRMVDEREGSVSTEDLPYAFNRKSVYARFAIVSAGPLINLLFAVLLYWCIFMIGTTGLKPVIGEVEPNSIASESQLMPKEEIIAIEGKRIYNWQTVHLELLQHLGDKEYLNWTVKPLGADNTQTKQVPLPNQESFEEVNLLKLIGIKPYWPDIEAVIGEVNSGLPADKAGLKADDKILSVDDIKIEDWSQWVKRIQASPEKTLSVNVLREGQQLTLSLTPEAKKLDDGRTYGFIGARAKPSDIPEELTSLEQYDPFDAIGQALKKTWDVSALSLKFLYKMVVGEVSTKNLGGPIAIAQGASTSLNAGVIAFLSFLALVSVSLGLINLFPIPMLDGGHLLFYVIEMIRGKPVADKHMFMALKAGFIFLIALMSFALYNDLARILG